MSTLLSRTLLAGAFALAASSAMAGGPDPNRLFTESELVVRDRFSVEIVGSGPDVVLVPGLMASREVWRATAERLRHKYRLHLVQLAGFSGEPARANASGEVLVPTAEALDSYLVKNKLAPAILVGHSWGGTALLYLAERHPEHLRKIMMVDTVPYLGTMRGDVNATVESWTPMARQLSDAMARGGPSYEAAATNMANIMVSGQTNLKLVVDWAARSDPSVVARAYYDDFMLDLRPDLASVRTPMTLVYPNDGAAGGPPDAKDQLYSQLWRASSTLTTRRVDASRHYVMLDQPQVFGDVLDTFLAR